MESKNGTDDFVTVVSVGTQPKIENFVTVLSIGNGKTEGHANGVEGQLDEEVEVYRLPGERLGFGLKFEGGNKTSERVRRLFVQSCAEHSPASRTKCSWGSLGEGDEILSIDGVPVTHMSRLDCVRHLKESQLVIKLLVRCRGALRPKVVSAERKSSPEKTKPPPELPPLPPPVPPRKLRQARGSADGDANPSPAKKIQNGHVNGPRGGSKSTSNDGCNSSPKTSNQKSPEFTKIKQEPPEAMVYLDARSQDGSSTHGSTSDDTGSSMSTVVDKTSASDCFSTASTTSTASENPNDTPKDSLDLLEAFDHLNKDFYTPPDYLLKRLANSEAVTHVESRGEAGAVVEKVTAVVAPNTVLIEETLTLQPPLSFQDAPLSYAHETRPGIFYTADLAADSTTHFRPIRDDASTVESVNGDAESSRKSEDTIAPPLPVRNHVNRIPVNQLSQNLSSSVSEDKSEANETEKTDDSLVPPKPLPRKDSKLKRKRLPPPPPPPPPPTAPRREAVPPVPVRNLEISKSIGHEQEGMDDVTVLEISSLRKEQEVSLLLDESIGIPSQSLEDKTGEINESVNEESTLESMNDDPKTFEVITNGEGKGQTNKVLEIIEMKRVKACRHMEQTQDKLVLISKTINNNNNVEVIEKIEVPVLASPRHKNFGNLADMLSPESSDLSSSEVWDEAREHQEDNYGGKYNQSEDEDEDETYTSLEQIDDFKSPESVPIIITESDDSETSSESSEDNGDDYYWQSNLATIGEEEETPSLEYTAVNKEPAATLIIAEPTEPSISHNNKITRESDDTEPVKGETPKALDKKQDKSAVNGRMDNCGGGQRLPPDGDEFPAAYQEFSASVQQYQYVVTPRTTTMTTNCTINDTEKFETSKQSQITESRITSQYIVTSKPDISLKQTDTLNNVNSHLEDSKRNPVTFTNAYSRDNKQQCVQGVVLTEKKIEIAGYYPKESKIDNETSGKDNLDSPPPLPLTGPPRYEKAIVHGRNANETCVNSRKFSLNGDLRRQDDKSEKSVRDKIAMFSKGSVELPLFPNNSVANVTVTSRRLPKYKSSEDFYADEDNKSNTMQSERCFSSCDLTDSGNSISDLLECSGGTERPPCPPRSSPPEESVGRVTSLYSKTSSRQMATPKSGLITSSASLTDVKSVVNPGKMNGGSGGLLQEVKNMPVLTRATSFSGGISYGELPPANGQVSRANSLASTFRRTEDMRRTSLNQLIEQRRKGISKLRGLVIPEKDAVPVDQPIIDLPEIKSRDSILVQQKASIIDKWGSQGSLASNASTQSMPIKTTTFKMPAPQILPKYSPAFKRKSLTVYGSSNVTSPSSPQTSPASTVTPTEPPKSLESICSPTRSDYSFEFVSSSVSPENIRNRPRLGQRKTRGDYDDSDNDSAVSSSQSSISRGFSPPTSPVPSDRSHLSSDRSYPVIMDSKNYLTTDRQYSKTDGYAVERTYLSSNGSSSGSSSGSNSSHSDPRSPLPEHNTKFTGIPQRQTLKRSSSTETNCSTSSTLTSGSQASAESLSRRVLKPQSVEAINRKNILASARCRSGRDLNGSPLIQRKFLDDEEIPIAQRNGNYEKIPNGNCTVEPTPESVKIAYVEVIEDFVCKDEVKIVESPKYLPKRTSSVPALKPHLKPDIILPPSEPSNDLKNWVRTEVEALLIEDSNRHEKAQVPQTRIPRTRSSLTLEEANSGGLLGAKKIASVERIDNSCNKSMGSHNDDLLTTLTTKSRSRAPINFEDGVVLRSKSQMSLEDILAGKTEPKRVEPQLIHSVSHSRLSLDSRDNKSNVKSSSTDSEDKIFVSKIPMFGRTRTDGGDESNKLSDRSRTSKIPMQRSLGRRSASVTDMKKALEKTDYSTNHHPQHGAQGNHHRCPSLDSSVEESIRSAAVESDAERFYGEQFGSISSLASSTSLISQQELALLVEEASLEEAKGSHEVIVVLLHKENPSGSVGITLAGGIDCEAKEITVHRVLAHSIADKDGRVQRGDRILSINGRSTRGISHRESLTVLKQPRSEVVLVVSRARVDEGGKLRTRTESVETIVEGFETNGIEDTAWGPPTRVAIFKDGAGLGFSLEGGRDSPLGDRALVIKKIFTGGAAEKTGALTAGDQLLEVNGTDVTRLSRIEAWSLMKKLQDGEVNLLVRHPATKSS